MKKFKCPYCGSEDGFYEKGKITGFMLLPYNAEGRLKSTSQELYEDNLDWDWDEYYMTFCGNCGKQIDKEVREWRKSDCGL